jgi:hypothetical protein
VISKARALLCHKARESDSGFGLGRFKHGDPIMGSPFAITCEDRQLHKTRLAFSAQGSDLADRQGDWNMENSIRNRAGWRGGRGRQGLNRNSIEASVSEIDSLAAREQLLQLSVGWSVGQLRLDLRLIPESPGIYGWWFRSFSPDVLEERTLESRLGHLLYIGTGPNGPNSSRKVNRSPVRETATCSN